MTNRLNFAAREIAAIDLGAVFTALQGNMAVLEDATPRRAEFSLGPDLPDIVFHFETIGGEINVTRMVLIDGLESVARGYYQDPQPMGIADWSDVNQAGRPGLAAALTDIDVVFRNTVYELANPSDASSVILNTIGADDLISGLDGNDLLRLGGGDDFADGAGGNDTLVGNFGNDLLVGGDGNDILRGGRGNDILVAQAGRTEAFGGMDRDLFVIESAASGTTVIRDFSADDVLLFTGTALNGTVGPLTDSLEKLPDGIVDDFIWAATPAGHLRIEAGDQVVILRNTLASDVDLDTLYFSSGATTDVIDALGTGPATTLGTSANGETMGVTGVSATAELNIGSGAEVFGVFGF